jgi:hypothetical protein
MAVWKWYTARVEWERVVIAVAIAGVVLALVWGTISSLTDEDGDDDVDDEAAKDKGTRAPSAPAG